MNYRRSLIVLLVVTLAAIPLLRSAGADEGEDWPLAEWLQLFKQGGYQLVAVVDGNDVRINTPEQYKKLLTDPLPGFKLVEIETGKEIVIQEEGAKKIDEWGRNLWIGLCDAAGLRPNCNGFFK